MLNLKSFIVAVSLSFTYTFAVASGIINIGGGDEPGSLDPHFISG